MATTTAPGSHQRLRAIDEVFSTWRADSQIMRLRRGELDHAQAHPWWGEVEGLSQEAERRTGGLFTTQLPDPASGERHYDPTGLVKGWAAQGASAHLAQLRDVAWCLNAGGDIVAPAPGVRLTRSAPLGGSASRTREAGDRSPRCCRWT